MKLNSTSKGNLFKTDHLLLRIRHFFVLSVLTNSTCIAVGQFCYSPLAPKKIPAIPLHPNNVYEGYSLCFSK
jgi:hypothetical protein